MPHSLRFSKEGRMRYHYEKPAIYLSKYGEYYTCEHLVYSKCTLLPRKRWESVFDRRYI